MFCELLPVPELHEGIWNICHEYILGLTCINIFNNQDEKKEKSPPKPAAQPYRAQKKSSATGEAPEDVNGAEETEQGDMFKMPRKKSSVAKRPVEKK